MASSEARHVVGSLANSEELICCCNRFRAAGDVAGSSQRPKPKVASGKSGPKDPTGAVGRIIFRRK